MSDVSDISISDSDTDSIDDLQEHSSKQSEDI